LQRREVELTEQGPSANQDKSNEFGVPIEYVLTKERMEKVLKSLGSIN
jgi:hypothetical protein